MSNRDLDTWPSKKVLARFWSARKHSEYSCHRPRTSRWLRMLHFSPWNCSISKSKQLYDSPENGQSKYFLGQYDMSAQTCSSLDYSNGAIFPQWTQTLFSHVNLSSKKLAWPSFPELGSLNAYEEKRARLKSPRRSAGYVSRAGGSVFRLYSCSVPYRRKGKTSRKRSRRSRMILYLSFGFTIPGLALRWIG